MAEHQSLFRDELAGLDQTEVRPLRPARRPGRGVQLRFLVLTAGILLAGALAAGLAAWTVVAPRAGIVSEQVTPAIPTALGQTAEAVRFPPWQLYDALEYEGLENWANVPYGNFDGRFLLSYFRVLGVPLEDAHEGGLLGALQASPEGTRAAQEACFFLQDYPAALADGTPVLLQFASMGPAYGGYGAESGFSFLFEPADPQPQSDGRQAEALEKVRQDLRDYLMLGQPVDFAPLLTGLMNPAFYVETGYEAGPFPVDAGGMEIYPANEWLLGPLNRECYPSIPMINGNTMMNELHNLGIYLAVGRDLAAAIAPGGDPSQLALDDFISAQNSYGTYSIQLITTPRQIVLLLTLNDTITGVYYDIQLERYSGAGMNYL